MYQLSEEFGVYMNGKKKRNVLESAAVSCKEVLRRQSLKKSRLVANYELHFDTLDCLK